MSETCATCRFFVQRRDDGAGTCHRFPPVTVLDPAGNYSVYCDSHAEHWCGEHRPAEQPERDAYTRAAVRYAEASIALNDAERLLTEAIDRKEPDTDDLRSDVCSAGYDHDDAEEAFEALYREKHGG